MTTVLLTGTAGFIGSRVAELLLEEGYQVIGLDNLNDYYDVTLKLWRLKSLKQISAFTFHKIDIENYAALDLIFRFYSPNAVINLAARAGVRYSMENPFIYLSTNAAGTLNLLELCRKYAVSKFVLASTSSLYAGHSIPFNEDLPVNTPISPYASSKKSAEAMAYSYHYLYDIDVSILRYFTVYGPAGRPDMSIFRFIKSIMEEKTIEIFGDGSQSRDFTYVDDIARGSIKALRLLGYEIINLGNNQPVNLMKVIAIIEEYTGKKALYEHKNFHKADLPATWANIDKAKSLLDWQPAISLAEGIKRTIDWFIQNWEWLQYVNI